MNSITYSGQNEVVQGFKEHLKSKWSSVVKSKVREYWSSHIHTMSQMYSSLQFLNRKSIYKGNVHPILIHKYYSALNIDRIPINLRIVTGSRPMYCKQKE